MIRNLELLNAKRFDLVVVGGGIHGICVARDASLRGLSVALLERGDFGAETSHSSLKLIHGGLRYIQHLEFQRMRNSVKERRAWLRIAPHLTRPMKSVMHTHGHFTRGPEALWVAGRIHELLGRDRNLGVTDEHAIPKSGVVGRQKADVLLPGLELSKRNGAAWWYDGQMQDADRIMVECLESAAKCGAVVANYAEVIGINSDGKTVQGVSVRDQLSGGAFDVSADITVNTAGPWADSLPVSTGIGAQHVMPSVPQNLNMNIVTRPIASSHAIGVQSKRHSDSKVDRESRLFFITPWRGLSVIGTTHRKYDGDTNNCRVSKEDILEFLAEINEAFPPAKLRIDDVLYCYWGLTPASAGNGRGDVRRARHSQVIVHEKDNGLARLISVLSVKWTTARLVAEEAVNFAAQQIGRRSGPCVTAEKPLPGAEGFSSAEHIKAEISRHLGPTAPVGVVNDLALEYGMRWHLIADSFVESSDLSQDEYFRRKATLAVQEEMAVRLVDVLCRRTSLLQRGKLTRSQVKWCLEMMAGVFQWSSTRKNVELDMFEKHCTRMHACVS